MTSFEIFDSLPSTQATAVDRLRAGEAGPGWILAREQTKGVGRHGRTWVGRQGNFMASRYETLTIDMRLVPQLSFVTALALFEALAPIMPDAETNLRIKWPNDLLHCDRKLAGILVQTEIIPDPERLGIVIGIGVNLAAAPEVAGYPTCSLREIAGEAIDPVNFLHRLDDCLAGIIKLWRSKGFEGITKAWLEHAYGRDMRLSLSQEGSAISGHIKGLDTFGALLIAADDGQIHSITSGDIQYGAAKPFVGSLK